MPIGLQLDLNDYNQNSNNLNQHIINTEKRMIKEQYSSPNFHHTIKSSTDIIDILSSAISKVPIGKGTHSEGYVVFLPNQVKYIIRETSVLSPLIRDQLIHEIKMYKHIQQYPESQQYISRLLYADVPLVYHKNQKLNNAYFVFEYVPGMTLDSLIKLQPQQKYSFEQIMFWFTHLSKAIQFLDSINILHRDIKPENIYMDAVRNIPLLFDLETSCEKGKDCLSYEFRGTREYASPKALKLLNQKDFSDLQVYQYTKFYDYYSLLKMLEKDFSKVILPDDKKHLLDYTKIMSDEILQHAGGNITKKYLTKRITMEKLNGKAKTKETKKTRDNRKER